MDTCEMEKDERKESVLLTALSVLDNLEMFVEDVALNPKEATPESVAALPKVAEAISHLLAVYSDLD